MENNILIKIIEEYYQNIYNYCYVKLNFNHNNAEDCTQEVFLILLKKQKKLNLSDNIKIWLYKTADNVIKTYCRKNKINDKILNIDEIEVAVENNFEVMDKNEVFNNILEEDYILLKTYYDNEYGNKEELAKQYNITVQKLYKQIHKIKSKLKH
ncbi:MAG: sigma-70 family RNA polymerase sigma factor [Ruminococcus sp.]|nr:sigma-70 family RNA polymerase sigma factor [Ruminococcus sp.]MDE7137019.1 sigma-70 family RNA polymerase sigma factor [Ruminococcus sp.]